MPEISFTGAFTAATAIVPDLYINATPGPGGIMPASFGMVGVEGVASWGPVNKPTIVGSPQAGLAFGNQTNRANDLATAINVILAAQQAAGLGANVLANRVSDGTDVAATADIGSVPASTETATVAGTLTVGDTLTVTLTSSGITGSPVHVAYTTVAGDTPTTMAAGLVANGNANAALQAANVSFKNAAGVVTITYPTSLSVAFSESVSPGNTETITLAAGSATTIYGLALTSLYTGSGANGDTWALAAGSNSTTGTPTWRLTLQHPGYPAEVFDNIGGGLTGAALWAALAAAVNNGNSIYRGPSQVMLATQGISTAAPVAANGTLSGGTDGTTALTSSVFVGSDTVPRTGIYAFRGSGVSDMTIADFDDLTQATTIQEFAQSEGIYFHLSGAPGTAVASARTAKQTQGAFGDNFAWIKWMLGDWVYWNDNLNGVQRLLAPATFSVALLSTLQPQQSGLNKQAYGVQATQRSKSQMPYGADELATLTSSGIDAFVNPIPRGPMFGLRIGCTSSAAIETFDDNWPRLTSFIARSLAGPNGLGALIGEEITPDYFQRGTALLNAFFDGLANPGPGARPVIQAYQVNFSAANNPQSQTARGVVVAQVLVQYFGIARIFLVNMQTGATVVIPAAANAASATAFLAAA